MMLRKFFNCKHYLQKLISADHKLFACYCLASECRDKEVTM
jgi:hypothetical protein